MGAKPRWRKVKIDYPPVPTRRWRSPFKPHVANPKHRKPMKRKPIYPKTRTFKHTTLLKKWKNYLLLGKYLAILYGSYDQNHSKYFKANRGKQGPANCFAAIAYTQIIEMGFWDRKALDLILETGNKLYRISIQINKNTCSCTNPKEVHNTFFIKDIQFVLGIGPDVVKGLLYTDDDHPHPTLKQELRKMLTKSNYCILEVDGKFMAIWKQKGSFYLFDPNGRNAQGKRVNPESVTERPACCRAEHKSYSVILKFLNSSALLVNCWDNCGPENKNLGFTLWPVYIKKVNKNCLIPPKDIDEVLALIPPSTAVELPPKSCLATQIDLSKPVFNKPSKVPLPGDSPKKEQMQSLKDKEIKKKKIPEESIVATPSNTPSLADLVDPEQYILNESMAPKEKPKPPIFTHFYELDPNRISIMHASFHQNDPKLSVFCGKQSLANAIAALTMLRHHKSKSWFPKILDEILLTGECIYLDSRKNLDGDQELTLKTLVNQYKSNKKLYTAEVEESTVIGKLNSTKYYVLDLPLALEEFFSDNDTGLIRGPLLIAVWIEEGKYYMFDPNERDQIGRALPTYPKIGPAASEPQEQGHACLTCFAVIQDLVNLYMHNCPNNMRREPFYISKVEIKDFDEIPEDWNNFTALRKDKWILRGYISQNNPRFQPLSRNNQATAVATIAVVYAKLKKPYMWQRETIDEILIEGDAFYEKCANALKAKNTYFDNMLMMSEMLTWCNLLGKELDIEIAECHINGILRRTEDTITTCPTLSEGLEEFFSDSIYGVVSAKGVSVAVFKDESSYFYFDSHSLDERGYKQHGGVAACVRVNGIKELANLIYANMGTAKGDLYNIARVDARMFDKDSDGTRKLQFRNYTSLTEKRGILRASTHQGDSEKFDIFADKQTIPNMYVALGMGAIYSSDIWSVNTMDEILDRGNKLYAETRKNIIKNDLENSEKWFTENYEKEEMRDLDEVKYDNCINEFKIGYNKMIISFDDVKEGIFETDLCQRRKSTGMTLDAILSNHMTSKPEQPDDYRHEAIIDSECITLAVWKQNNVFYAFDPKAKDSEGSFYGRDIWSEKICITDEDYDDQYEYDHDKKFELGIPSEPSEKPPASVYGEGSMEDEIDYYQPIPEADMSDAKACTLMFSSFDELYSHIIGNIPPNKRTNLFKLYPVKLNAPVELKAVKNVLQRQLGNWFHFSEIDLNRWILRGTMTLHHRMYPEINRGKQYCAMGITACAYGRLYAPPLYKTITVDDILKYGDRLHTVIRMEKEKAIQNECEEIIDPKCIEEAIANMQFSSNDTPRYFYLGNYLVMIDIEIDFIAGDLTVEDKKPVEMLDEDGNVIVDVAPSAAGDAPDEETPELKIQPMLSLKQGLEQFFETDNYGILNAKNTAVAIWKILDFYYMFDPEERGPLGVKETGGYACITRFANLEQMAKVIQSNMPKAGSNTYTIDQIIIHSKPAKRPKPFIEEIIPADPKITAFHEISEGKMILRGRFHQDNSRFGLRKNATGAANAMIALAMSHIHKSETWTQPIIDDILCNAFRLFNQSVESLGYEFNTWEDTMKAELLNPEFSIGVMKVSTTIVKEGLQQGILSIKHPTISNLRRACEEFFIVYNHGIIETTSLTAAIWLDKDLIYMYDPNCRGLTGLFSQTGAACLMVFKSIKLMTDHFLANVPDHMHTDEFSLTPIEFNIMEIRCETQPPLKKTDILKVKAIDSLTDQDENEEGGKKKSKKRKKEKKHENFKHGNLCYCPDKSKTTPYQPLELDPSKFPAEKKKMWLRAKCEAKRLKETHILEQKMRRAFYDIGNGIAIVRAHYSQNSDRYDTFTRNKQTLPNALIAIVMSKLHSPNTWSYKNLEIILDSGDVLYKDSFIKYKPKNPFLGLKNLLRKFYLLHLKINTVIYKPCIYGDLRYEELYCGLLNFFMHETSGILLCDNLTVAIFQKAGQFFMFDSHERNMQGEPVFEYEEGVACCLQFPNIEYLVDKYITNTQIDREDEIVPQFSICPVTIEGVQQTK